MKSISARCPIHQTCRVVVFFGNEADGRIPFPDPALIPIAEQDYPGLVPIRAEHQRSESRFGAGLDPEMATSA
jgi:hypothetical protein